LARRAARRGDDAGDAEPSGPASGGLPL
jgi:hypothetical protein